MGHQLTEGMEQNHHFKLLAGQTENFTTTAITELKINVVAIVSLQTAYAVTGLKMFPEDSTEQFILYNGTGLLPYKGLHGRGKSK